MTDRVPTDQIELIVGARRRKRAHLARAVSAEKNVYILHSEECTRRHPDLRLCAFSLALDLGIELDDWAPALDKPVEVGIWHRRLIPVRDALAGTLATRKPNYEEGEA